MAQPPLRNRSQSVSSSPRIMPFFFSKDLNRKLGVPVGLISGDQVVAEQIAKRAPWIERVVVKQALSRVAGDVIPPARARGLIRAGAKRAVERAMAGELSLCDQEKAPYAIEVELREAISEGLRGNLATLPEFELEGDRIVRTSAPDMDQGFRRIAYLGFGDRPGLTRY